MSPSVGFAVLGGSTTGLAVAAELSRYRTTFALARACKRHKVVQSGIYYEPGSLASRLTVLGRNLLYDRCKQQGIGHDKTQKLVVATANNQVPHLDMLQSRSLHPALRQSSATLGSSDTDSTIPAYFMSGDEARALEPALSRSVLGAVLLTEAGTVDAAALDESFIHEVEENHGAVLDAKVINVRSAGKEWEVVFEVDGQEDAFRAGQVVSFAAPNATERYLSYGHSGIQIHPSPMQGSDMAFARMALGRFGPIYHDLSPAQIRNIGRGIQTFIDIDPDRLELVTGDAVNLDTFHLDEVISGADDLGVAASMGIAKHVAGLYKRGKSLEEMAEGWS